MDSLVANLNSTAEEATWSMFEQFLWDWEVPLQKFTDNSPYFAIVFSTLGLIAGASLRTGTSTMPFVVTIGLSDVVTMTGRAMYYNDFVMESKFIQQSFLKYM